MIKTLMINVSRFVVLTAVLGIFCVTAFSQSVQEVPLYTTKKATPDGTGKYYMGREIAHVMGAGGASWLDRNSRKQEENTNMAISKFPLTATSKVADIGAGSGYYSFKVAPKVPGGKVYAVEIQDEMISILKGRKKELKNTNVEIVKGDMQSPIYPIALLILLLWWMFTMNCLSRMRCYKISGRR